jgi:hypothetical protein
MKGRMMHEIKRICDELEAHERTLQEIMRRPRTLKDMLLLMGDVVAKLEEVENKAAQHGLEIPYSEHDDLDEEDGEFDDYGMGDEA